MSALSFSENIENNPQVMAVFHDITHTHQRDLVKNMFSIWLLTQTCLRTRGAKLKRSWQLPLLQ
jgi:hypothetical protein